MLKTQITLKIMFLVCICKKDLNVMKCMHVINQKQPLFIKKYKKYGKKFGFNEESVNFGIELFNCIYESWKEIRNQNY